LLEPLRTFLDHPEVVEPLSRLSAAEFDERRANIADLVIIDVRNTGEVAEGAIEGSVHIPLPALLGRVRDLDSTVPTVVHCAGGYRSAIAASMLRSHGFIDVSDLIGGYTAWAAYERQTA
jgi:hydroxyacylglutathione hydrolase